MTKEGLRLTMYGLQQKVMDKKQGEEFQLGRS